MDKIKSIISMPRQGGSLTVEFALTMIIAAAILIPVVYLTLDMAKEVLEQFIGWVTPSWP